MVKAVLINTFFSHVFFTIYNYICHSPDNLKEDRVCTTHELCKCADPKNPCKTTTTTPAPPTTTMDGSICYQASDGCCTSDLKIKEKGAPCRALGGECVEEMSECDGVSNACHSKVKVYIFLFH